MQRTTWRRDEPAVAERTQPGTGGLDAVHGRRHWSGVSRALRAFHCRRRFLQKSAVSQGQSQATGAIQQGIQTATNQAQIPRWSEYGRDGLNARSRATCWG